MPIYEYKCSKCGNVFVLMEKVSSEGELRNCPECSGTATKIISQTSFHLKGGGWYVTDYKGSSPKDKTPVCNTKDTSAPACCTSCQKNTAATS